MADVKNINGYNIKDETARNEIETIKASVPTKTSQLTNDSNFATQAYVNNQIIDFEWNTLKKDYALKTDMPTNTSDLTNDSGFILSGSVVRIEIVSELPEVEEEGVLYFVKNE